MYGEWEAIRGHWATDLPGEATYSVKGTLYSSKQKSVALTVRFYTRNAFVRSIESKCDADNFKPPGGSDNFAT